MKTFTGVEVKLDPRRWGFEREEVKRIKETVRREGEKETETERVTQRETLDQMVGATLPARVWSSGATPKV